MESELNKKIRELLEMFGVDTKKKIGKWVLEGHIKNLVKTEIIAHLNQQEK